MYIIESKILIKSDHEINIITKYDIKTTDSYKEIIFAKTLSIKSLMGYLFVSLKYSGKIIQDLNQERDFLKKNCQYVSVSIYFEDSNDMLKYIEDVGCL